MITAEEREESFKRDLIELLEKHSAELTITEGGLGYGLQHGVANVVMMGAWDEDNNQVSEYCDFNLPTYLP